MKDFLNEYLITLSGKRNTHISELLSAASVSKNDLDSIADKLRDAKKDSPIVISKEGFGGIIRRAGFDGSHRDANRRVLDLFQVSNTISLLLDSHIAVLSSEIKALEDEIIAMEKSIANYAFTLSDNGFYDYAFTETFNDDTMKESDSANIKFTDRSGIDFANDEKAIVNSAAGILSLSPSLNTSYPLSGGILNSNCLALSTSNSGLDNAFNVEVSNGWRLAVSSPKPFTSKINQNLSKQGAQVELEVFLSAPSPCDTIVLTPFSDIPIDIMKIVIFNDNADQTTSKVILDGSVILNRTLIASFPLQSVSKFKITLNQSIYSRGETPAVRSEVVYRDFYTDIKSQKDSVTSYTGRSFNKNKKALKRIFINSQNKNTNLKIFKSEIPEIDFEPTFGPLTIDKIIKGYNPNNPDQDMWSRQSKVNTFMRRMIDEKVFSSNTDILNDRHTFNANQTFLSINSPLQMTMLSGNSSLAAVGLSSQQPLSADLLSYPVLQEQQYLDYQYNLGLRNIQIGSGDKTFRGVFISKQIPAPSDSGEVKIKVDDTNFQLLETSRDSTVITSIEYSICNKSNPTIESDWVSILPIDTDFVDAERLFINELGIGFFRFPASVSGRFEIYKNGFRMDLSSILKINSPDGESIKGVQIPSSYFVSTDIFTINYEPYGNQSIINFEDRGLGASLLATAFDDSGAGETFSSTYNNQVITLKNDPFINYDNVDTYGSYSATLGFVSTYQPITIVLSDGSVALNQTNYKGNIQNDLSTFDETKTAYIHSGKNVIFNKPITEKFTVYYQYLPSNLRFRIVMRVNDADYVSPSVNSIQLKTKTRKADSRNPI